MGDRRETEGIREDISEHIEDRQETEGTIEDIPEQWETDRKQKV